MFGLIAFFTAKRSLKDLNLNETIQVGFRAVVATAVITFMAFTTIARYNLGLMLIPND